jgi:hypothetical protein
VRQGSKRERIPEVLEADQIMRLLMELQHPYKAMVLIVTATGFQATARSRSLWVGLWVGVFGVTSDNSLMSGLRRDSNTRPLP